MRALLDTNIVLDSLLARAPWCVDADEILRQAKPGFVDLAVSALTVANLFYIGRKLVGVDRARRDVRTCLAALQILPIDEQTLAAADALAGSDFEDNIQMASAVAAQIDYIITRNVADFSGGAIRAVAPAQFLALLPPA